MNTELKTAQIQGKYLTMYTHTPHFHIELGVKVVAGVKVVVVVRVVVGVGVVVGGGGEGGVGLVAVMVDQSVPMSHGVPGPLPPCRDTV